MFGGFPPQACCFARHFLRDHVSSLQRRSSSLTSDLSHLQGLLSRSREESSSLLLACALLAGAFRHTHRRAHTLCEQKALLSRRLAAREALEDEVRRLAAALGGEEEEEEGSRKRALKRWRRSLCVVLAARRWRLLAGRTTVLFQVEVGGGAPAVGVCGGTTTQEGQDGMSAG